MEKTSCITQSLIIYENAWSPLQEMQHPVYSTPNSKTNGFGTKKYHFGSVYVGEWKNNERNGKGTMKWCNGDVYKGEWKNDRRHGFGETTFEND